MNGKESALIFAFAIGVPLLTAEHVYSANLSSPWTTGKLAKTPEDHAAFWMLFTEATVASLFFAVVIGLVLYHGTKEVGPLLAAVATTGGVAVWMYWDYSRALDGSLYQTTTQKGVT